ncbi:glycine/sarcosine/betaine reductase selenoprotein B family protein [Rubrobacter aplysinae]|uniref:glycine/sarcosine/betaine reductase selenoprotein B family protein n=1 Tax=Rubrobacter aplysinae TaxID=909625 RepID=UPI00069FD87A|nr:glycine/sarcosine/betaine reductase selenoprotein B family protein [Rubrobacter aplysinae]
MTEPARLDKPLSEARIALVTTGGVHLPEDDRFDIDDPAGDCSYREIPTDSPGLDGLTWTHAYFADRRSGSSHREDLDCVFPLWTMLGLVEEGVVGGLNRRHFSFMGAIHDTTGLEERTAPEVSGLLAEDAADAVLLTPS